MRNRLLAVMVLGAVLSRAGEAPGQAARPAPRPAPRVIEGAAETVQGYGKTRTKAVEQAALHAQERVEKMLIARFGDDGWRPTARQLDPNYLSQMGVIVLDGEPAADPALDDGRLVARYKVGLTPGYLGALQKAAQQERVHDRHLILLRVLAGLVVLLLVTTGYLRLEEMTRGYATALLRAMALLVLLLTGLGIFLTWPV